MTPHLVKWHEQFADQGLVVIEIDNGKMDRLEDLREHIAQAGVEFPVLHDGGGRICSDFGVRMYPTAYLIGRDGQVVWEGNPNGNRQLSILKSLL